MNKEKRDFVKGASASLNKSIGELVDYLDERRRPDTPTGALRQELHNHLTELAILWFRRGFRRGCMETHSAYISDGEFPAKVVYEAARTFYQTGKRPVKMRWTPSSPKRTRKSQH